MLSPTAINVSINATSIIDNQEVVGFSGQIRDDGTYSISKDIRNWDMYALVKQDCAKDYIEFEQVVEDYVSNHK